METEVAFSAKSLEDIESIQQQLLQYQYGSPLYKQLVKVLESISLLGKRAHMFPTDTQNPKYRKWSVGGYVIIYSWDDNDSVKGPLATVARVIPSNWNRTNETRITTSRSNPDILPTTPENIAAAKIFVLRKWRERAIERGHDEPADLSSACKFSSLFAAKVFGGKVRGNFFHQWCELPDGRPLDINDEAVDVVAMLNGKIPDDTRAYASASRKTLPQPLYTYHEPHMRSKGNRESMASVEPRVDQWVREFLMSR